MPFRLEENDSFAVTFMDKLASSPRISVVVPVCNAGHLLERCVRSIRRQTLTDLEIILVDDGSTDGSGDFCESLAKEDDRIRVHHQANQGPGYTRCKGFSLSRGKYVAFVDADDYIEPRMYEAMLSETEARQADICVCFFNYEYPDKKQLYKRSEQDASMLGTFDSMTFAHFYFEHGAWANGVVASACNKLYSRSVLQGMAFTSRYAEDEELNDWLNARHYKIVCIPDIFYHWCQNENSVTTKPFSSERWNFLKVLEKRMELYASDPYLVNCTKQLYGNVYVEYYYKSQVASAPVPDRFRKNFLSLVSGMKQDPAFARTRFLARMRLFLLSPKLYQWIIRIRK